MFKKSLGIILLTAIILQTGIPVVASEIEDEVAIQSFSGQKLHKYVVDNKIIEDNAVKELSNKLHSKVTVNTTIIEDTVVNGNIELKKATRPNFKFKLIDEHSEIVRVPVSSIAQIKAVKEIKEGQIVVFKVLKDVHKHKTVYIKKGTPVEAYIETLTPPSFGGDPAEISVGRFTTIDINGNKIELIGEVQKQGANRAIWVRPLADIVSNVPVYGLPLMLLYFVKGGNAKIKTTHEFVLCAE